MTFKLGDYSWFTTTRANGPFQGNLYLACVHARTAVTIPLGPSAEPLQDSVTQCRSWNVFFHGTTRFLCLSFLFSHCTEDPQRTVILATGHGYSYVFPCKTLENNGPGYISVPIFSVLCQRWEHTRKPATVEWVRQNLSAGLRWGVGIMMLLCSLFTPSWTKTSGWWQTG